MNGFDMKKMESLLSQSINAQIIELPLFFVPKIPSTKNLTNPVAILRKQIRQPSLFQLCVFNLVRTTEAYK